MVVDDFNGPLVVKHIKCIGHRIIITNSYKMSKQEKYNKFKMIVSLGKFVVQEKFQEIVRENFAFMNTEHVDIYIVGDTRSREV